MFTQLKFPSFPLYLAPMAGFTDTVFRRLCRTLGADVVVSEFVMANRFLCDKGQDSAWEIVDFSPDQRPMGIQIFGSDPARMAEAARRIVARLEPDFIDINYGCPAPKIVDQCAGSSLLQDLPRLQAVAQAVVQAISPQVPVSAKIRIGWDAQHIVAVEASQMLEAVGVQAIAIHGRTKVQGYGGDADWDTIAAAAAAVRIPVIGNGSVRSAYDVERIQKETGVRGLMIGRAALGYPWLFREIKHQLMTGESLPPPSLEERWHVLLNYARELSLHSQRERLWNRLHWMRPRLKAFTKNIPGSRELRNQLETVTTYADLEALAEQHLAQFGPMHGAQMPCPVLES